jgi:hypothetical protein
LARAKSASWLAIDLHARARGDGVGEALLAVDGRRGAGGALELDDLRLPPWLCAIDGGALALLDEVRGDRGDEVRAGLGDRGVDVRSMRKTGMSASAACFTTEQAAR